MRTFVNIREMVSEYAEIKDKLTEHDAQIQTLFDGLGKLIQETQTDRHQTSWIAF